MRPGGRRARATRRRVVLVVAAIVAGAGVGAADSPPGGLGAPAVWAASGGEPDRNGSETAPSIPLEAVVPERAGPTATPSAPTSTTPATAAPTDSPAPPAPSSGRAPTDASLADTGGTVAVWSLAAIALVLLGTVLLRRRHP
ncbi:hypothetical protein [Microbacterium sp. 18062]|uniref:hypothetical protein n=1 Tax=Microbacterium sp. 18062 TaxID=2681410 RepID=UPI001359AF53|nr:hypothetical protein [Microbacterium sp. 18062]